MTDILQEHARKAESFADWLAEQPLQMDDEIHSVRMCAVAARQTYSLAAQLIEGLAPVEAMTESQIEAGAKALYGAVKETLCEEHDTQLWANLSEQTKRAYCRKALIVINTALKAV